MNEIQEAPKRQFGVQELLRSPSFKQSIEIRLAGSEDDTLRFIKMFESSVRKNPKLLECTPKSIELAAYKLADIGLSTVDTYKQLYLKPEWNSELRAKECVIDVMWRGLCVLAFKLGGVAIQSDVVFEGDFFECEKGAAQRLEHKINLTADRSESKMVAVYAIATYPNGSQKIEVMNKQQTDFIKAIAVARNKKESPAWKDFYTEMARKTVVKRLCKQLNEFPEISALADIDSDTSYFDNNAADPEQQSKTASQRLTDRIRNNVQKKVPAEPIVVNWQEEDEEELIPAELPPEYVYQERMSDGN